MSKLPISKIAKNMGLMVRKHSPEILTGIGIAGLFTTTILAVKATPKALKLIEEAKNNSEEETLSAGETVKACWKCYIPAAVTAVASTSCLIFASSTHLKRNAALATAYKLSETALTEYKAKVVETIGEKKEKVIRDSVAKEKLEKNAPSLSNVIITGKGGTTCYDCLSGRTFQSDIDLLKRAQNEINRKLIDEMYVSLNEFYDEVGLDHNDLGDLLGWNIDDGLLDLDFSAQISPEDEKTPIIVMDYNVAPKYGYDRC